jgi:uncharacterized protein (TIGR00369 family)
MPSRIASSTYGTVSADKQKEMTGLEFVQGLADATLPLNTMARTLGYDITEAERERVVVTAVPKDSRLNPAGTVHGGLAAAILDSCMGLAIHSTLEKGVGSTTLEFKMSFVRPITPETGMVAQSPAFGEVTRELEQSLSRTSADPNGGCRGDADGFEAGR